eukprot:scaffold65439_cov46-Attheya_sp.AAC.2
MPHEIFSKLLWTQKPTCPPSLFRLHDSRSPTSYKTTVPRGAELPDVERVCGRFFLAAVDDAAGSKLDHTGRAALHAIHGIFPPPAVSGHVGGKDPISVKKLEKGDARWDLIKEF